MDAEPGFGRPLPKKLDFHMADEVGIEFERYDTVGPLQQVLGQSTASRADLDDERRMIATGSYGNALENFAADEEMLP
jgi:hypothetical protein